ncbi:DNA-binding transcriptional LysR family regulator [Kribbella sp. VKM Ac-2527]|uniref:DNA-binding transcriptional LysR family regulator n=1 Tax=Kribbella caucasensis TaxID=2512215 RepID=A0A4R6KP62_9ACTN|nr:LysR family transcriptional regulator [Kribbella sp. VKM Ac-2527]TDO54446.1 DNA-binding transcriptional LysR family regulator [Kribbella sp. VKM Ac-2527]
MDLEIRHLRVVAAIAETGSISRASVLLGHSQPAVTGQLQRIERALGGPLFARDGSGARPTALGAMVLSHAQGIIALHDGMMRDVRRREADDADLRTLRLGATASPMAAGLVTVSRQLLPDAEVSLHVSDSDEELIELLVEARLEVGLSADYPGYELAVPEELTEAVLVVEPVFIVLSKDHPLAAEAEIPLAALADEQWLPGDGKDVRMRKMFRDACRRAGFAPRRVQRTSASVVFSLISQGHGVSLCRAITVERENVVVRPLAGDPMWVRERLLWSGDGPVAEHAPRIRDALVAAYQAQAEAMPAYRAWQQSRGRP